MHEDGEPLPRSDTDRPLFDPRLTLPRWAAGAAALLLLGLALQNLGLRRAARAR